MSQPPSLNNEMTDFVKKEILLSSVISKYEPLLPKGYSEKFGYQFQVRCQFHEDSNPSMIVSDG